MLLEPCMLMPCPHSPVVPICVSLSPITFGLISSIFDTSFTVMMLYSTTFVVLDFKMAFLLRVIGDSMNKVIPPNMLALIDPDVEVQNGDIAAIAVNGFDATLKRFYKFQDGITLEPESYNPEYKTQFYDSKAQEFTPVVVKGKLVWYMAPLNVKF